MNTPTIKSYGGTDVELEGYLRRFYKSTENPLIPVVVIAVAPKVYTAEELKSKSAIEVSRSSKRDYATLLERLKETAEKRAKKLGICEPEQVYLTNIAFDRNNGVMKADLFEQRCLSVGRPPQKVKTYSGSSERLKEVLQRQLRPVEHFAVDVGKGKGYVETLDELVKSAESLAARWKLESVYVANIEFTPEEGIIKGDLLEVGEYSTACETIA